MRRDTAARSHHPQPASTTKPTPTQRDRENAVRQYEPLVRSIAEQYAGHNRRGADLDDLLQAGYVGVLRAVDTFDPDLGSLPGRIKRAVIDAVRTECGLDHYRDRQRPDLTFDESQLGNPADDPFPERDFDALLQQTDLTESERALVDAKLGMQDDSRESLQTATGFTEQWQRKLELSIARKLAVAQS